MNFLIVLSSRCRGLELLHPHSREGPQGKNKSGERLKYKLNAAYPGLLMQFDAPNTGNQQNIQIG
jgi:hypothetical protein